jgi:trk system potassium uptake protein TrkA
VPEGSLSEWRDASGTIQLCEMHPHKDWFGRPIAEIELAIEARVAFLTRLAEGLIPDEHTVLQEGDLMHVTVRAENTAAVEAILARSPEDHS